MPKSDEYRCCCRRPLHHHKNNTTQQKKSGPLLAPHIMPLCRLLCGAVGRSLQAHYFFPFIITRGRAAIVGMVWRHYLLPPAVQSCSPFPPHQSPPARDEE